MDQQPVIETWITNNEVTVFLIKNLPDSLLDEKVPGYKRKTIRMILGHLHNCRCMWIKRTGPQFGIDPPSPVDRYNVSKKEILEALDQSSLAITSILEEGLKNDRSFEGFYRDVFHFNTYLISHEAHHRGQIIMLATQLGYDLEDEVKYGVWKWNSI